MLLTCPIHAVFTQFLEHTQIFQWYIHKRKLVTIVDIREG